MGRASGNDGCTGRAFGFGQCFSRGVLSPASSVSGLLRRIATLLLLSVVPVAAAVGQTLDASSYFLEAPEYSTGGLYAESVAVADVNGDGIPDLVVANACLPSGGTCIIDYGACSTCAGGEVAVLLGNGDGTFQAPVAYDSGGSNSDLLAVVAAGQIGRAHV